VSRAGPPRVFTVSSNGTNQHKPTSSPQEPVVVQHNQTTRTQHSIYLLAKLTTQLTNEPVSAAAPLTISPSVRTIDEVYRAAEQLFGLSGGIIVGLELEEPSSASSTAITSVEQVRGLPQNTHVVFRCCSPLTELQVSPLPPNGASAWTQKIMQAATTVAAPTTASNSTKPSVNLEASAKPAQWTVMPISSWKAANAAACIVQPVKEIVTLNTCKRLRPAELGPNPNEDCDEIGDNGDYNYMRTKAHNARGTEQDYRCGYCGLRRTSASSCTDGRVRIRCPCGGLHRDGKPRMHAKWIKLAEKDCQDTVSPTTMTTQITTPHPPINPSAPGSTVVAPLVPMESAPKSDPEHKPEPVAAQSCVIESSTRVAQQVTDATEESRGAKLETLLGALLEGRKLSA